eukprot:scaffold54502_cov26-Tisochrysis_lutea.AAC.4
MDTCVNLWCGANANPLVIMTIIPQIQTLEGARYKLLGTATPPLTADIAPSPSGSLSFSFPPRFLFFGLSFNI